MKRLLDLVFGASKRTALVRTGGKSQSKIKRRQLKLESLENRRVFDVEFGSLIGIGNGESVSAALDVAADATGNRYVTGYFSGHVDFDEANTHAGDVDLLMAEGTTDAYIAKYAPDDSLLWVRRFGSNLVKEGAAITDRGLQVGVDSTGNVFVAGTHEGISQFGSLSLTSGNGRDGYLAKLSSTGTVSWVRSWDLNAADAPVGMDVDDAGNVALLNSAATTTPNLSVDIRKYGTTGALSWSTSIVTNRVATGDIALDVTGNVYVTGNFGNSVDFDPGPKQKIVSSVGSLYQSTYVLNLTSLGKFGWVSPFLGGWSAGAAIDIDGSGNVIVGGSYANESGGSVDFNPAAGTATQTSKGGYLTKLTSKGAYVWSKGLDGNDSSGTQGAGINDLTLDASGSIYVSGYVTGTVDLDPSAGVALRTSNGSHDIIVAKYSSSGAYQWGESFGGEGYDTARVAVDGFGSIHLAGYFQYTVDFDAGAGDSTLSTNGTTYKGFLKKLRQV